MSDPVAARPHIPLSVAVTLLVAFGIGAVGARACDYGRADGCREAVSLMAAAHNQQAIDTLKELYQ